MARQHNCLNGKISDKYSWWEMDAQGIPLALVCEDCEEEKLKSFRPEILTGYTQADVDEPIEAEA